MRLAQARIETYSGPLPHPDILSKYEQLVPGSAARIIESAHAQTEHRMTLEKSVVHSDRRRANAGLLCALLVSLAVLGCGTYLVAQGHDWAGGTIITTVMVGVITAFLVGTVQRRREREHKAQMQIALVQR